MQRYCLMALPPALQHYCLMALPPALQVLISRDDLEREVRTEKGYSEELSRIVGQIKQTQREFPSMPQIT